MERTPVLTDGGRSTPRNRLLTALPHEVLSSLRADLKPVSLPRGTMLYEADDPLGRVYFVETGIVSLVTPFENGTTPEVTMVGREGMVGIGALLGKHALGRYVMLLPGFALAVDVPRFQSALRASPEFRAVCEAYAQAFLAHLLQNAACGTAHNVEQRYARWLLRCGDQTDDTFQLTQESIAELLGELRSTVTGIAQSMQQARLIHYRRGTITLLDRRGLEAAACECYRIVRDCYERALKRTAG